MSTSDFADKLKLPLWKVNRVNSLLIHGVAISEIQKRLNLKNAKLNLIVSYFSSKKSLENAFLVCVKQPYWTSENEMEIPVYTIDDLKGDELAYLESL